MFRLFACCVRHRLSAVLVLLAAPVLVVTSTGWAAGPVSTTTALTVTSAGSPVTSIKSGTVITLTARVADAGSQAPVSPGQVRFCDATAPHCEDAALLATAQLTPAGTATFRFVPSVGPHTYKAVFIGTTSNSTSMSTADGLTVTLLNQSLATSTLLASSGSPGNYTVTATVVGTGSQTLGPTGSVTFPDITDGNVSIGSAALGASTAGQVFTDVQDIRNMPAYKAATGDFNGDGLLDLAGVNGDVLTILQNTGGSLAVSGTYTVGPIPTAIAVADVNGDGFLDLAVASESGPVTLLLGSASGTFSTAASFGDSSGALAILTGDFNGDGNVDFVTVPDVSSNDRTVLLGKGDGTFVTDNNPGASGSSYPEAVGDFNNDGLSDIVLTALGRNVIVLLGQADGSFKSVAGPSIVDGSSSLVTGDFNGDGNLDLAVVNTKGTFFTLLGRGNGNFDAPRAGTVKAAAGLVSTGDFNNDGITDILTTSGNVLLGNGRGTFTVLPGPYLPSDAYLLAGDFTGDGLPDLVFPQIYQDRGGNTVGTISLFANQFTQTATATLTHAAVPIDGNQYVGATYPGDANFTSSVSINDLLLVGVEPATTLTLTSIPNPSTFGGQVTITATLSPYTSAGGSSDGEPITFFANGALLGTGTLSSGKASFKTSGLPVGLTTLTATYAGDFNLAASASNSLDQTVKAGTGPVPGYVVTVTADAATGKASRCTGSGSSNCSLRDALAASVASGGGNITFSKAIFAGPTPAPAIQLVASLVIPGNTTITAPTTGSTSTQSQVLITGDGSDTPLVVNKGSTQIAISGLSLDGGPYPYGDQFYVGQGGLYNDGALTLSNMTISGFRFEGMGGGISNDVAGVMSLSNSVIYENSPSQGGTIGAGIFNAGNMKVTSTVITSNGGRDMVGGGIFNITGATMSLTNTTVSHNVVYDGSPGGGIFNEGTLTITSSTITDNSASNSARGSGIAAYGVLKVTNSLLADNITTDDGDGGPVFEDDCDGTGCPANGVAGNVVGAGLSSTSPQSAAICAGVVADIPAGLAKDQRGVARTTTYGSTTCVDAGALQQHYALSFATQPPSSVNANSAFSAAVQLSESGHPFTAAGIAIPLALGSGNKGSLSGGTSSTDVHGVATYNQLKVSAAGAGDTLVSILPVTTTPAPPSQSTVLSARAVSSSFTVVAPQPPAAPTFSPGSGTYPLAQSVKLSDTTTGASIYYTTNGAKPTSGSMLYTMPINVAATGTINAIAVLNGVSSTMSSATYTIDTLACQTIDYSKGFTTSGLSLNGGAKVTSSLLQLTDGGLSEARSAFYKQLVPVTGYTTDFTFQILNPLADGITFTIQANNPQVVGQVAGGLGYAGIGQSVAVKFDLFNNSGEGYNSTGVYYNGAYPALPAIDLGPAGLSLHSTHIFAVHLVYANGVATATITDTATSKSVTQSVTADLSKMIGSQAYVGFTAGTGSLSSVAEILTWSFEGGTGCSTR